MDQENSDENIVYPCDLCDQVFKYKHALYSHKKCAHRAKVRYFFSHTRFKLRNISFYVERFFNGN